MGFGPIGLESRRFTKRRDGLLRFPSLTKDQAQVPMRFREIGPLPNRLAKVKNSARNSALTDSLMGMCLMIVISKFLMPSMRQPGMLRGVVPKANGSGKSNADGLTHCAISSPRDRLVDRQGSPTRLERLPAKPPPKDPVLSGETKFRPIGNPLDMVMMPPRWVEG